MVLHQIPYRYQTHWTGRQDCNFVAFREGLLAFNLIDHLQRQQANRKGKKPVQSEQMPPLYPGNQFQNYRGAHRQDQNPRINTYDVEFFKPYELQNQDCRRDNQLSYRGRKCYFGRRSRQGWHYRGAREEEIEHDCEHFNEVRRCRTSHLPDTQQLAP
ncbi:hypothetical protein PR048_008580 [Dryococelus australis]|uniref:Uncharacterized protein n=1 Tax=Dryococelus australis TaxID=614101 RepID=A0ABQ9HYB0_9NEOP|nr:hypothetical protein PR048_008580 [Dryococelus australis]